jgi:hypothetical protein
MALPPGDGRKAIYIKLTPGTELYDKVVAVADETDVSLTKAGRMMMRNGWAGWKRFMASVGRTVIL